MTSGSSAMARARATRLRCPPESSAGIFLPASGRPTRRSFCSTISPISSAGLCVCSTRGKAMFSPTVERVEQRAHLEEKAESLRGRPSSSRSGRLSIRLPSNQTSPSSGRSRPTMCLSSTLLPRAAGADDDEALAALDRQIESRRARPGGRIAWRRFGVR